MPLLLVSGNVASGKTTISKKIADFMHTMGHEEVKIISDTDVAIPVDEEYELPEPDGWLIKAAPQKEILGKLRWQVANHLEADRLVVVDSVNFIKGFRYEMYCIAKKMKTTFAQVFCDADIETCKWLNKQKEEDAQHEEELIEMVANQFELPNENNRWDSPLFKIKIGTEESCDVVDAPMDQDLKHKAPRFITLPLYEIYSALFEGESLAPNKSTESVPHVGPNYIHEVDAITQEIVESVFNSQRTATRGQMFEVPYVPPGGEKFKFLTFYTMTELARMKRQFVLEMRDHPVEGREKIAALFIAHLNDTIQALQN